MSDPLLTDDVIGQTSAGAACCAPGAADPCPCETSPLPIPISNLPGLSSISYRVGNFSDFREAMLRSLPGEQELGGGVKPPWRPAPQGDLALQLVDWWAYLADILTFYNERIANESYLETAQLPESVQRLIRTLGYRPRPGLGATGSLAALVTGRKPPTLLKGFQIQSKPGPGELPQIFELDQDVSLTLPDALPALPADVAWKPLNNGILLAGPVSGVKPGDELLLLPVGYAGQNNNFAVIVVGSVTSQTSPAGKANTLITPSPASTWGSDL